MSANAGGGTTDRVSREPKPLEQLSAADFGFLLSHVGAEEDRATLPSAG